MNWNTNLLKNQIKITNNESNFLPNVVLHPNKSGVKKTHSKPIYQQPAVTVYLHFITWLLIIYIFVFKSEPSLNIYIL